MRPPITFDEAVEKTYDRISDHITANGEWIWQDSTDDQSVLRHILKLRGSWYLERDREKLFEKSKQDRAYYDMLRFALSEKVFLSLALEPDEAQWVAEALAGEHTVPAHKSRAYTAADGVRKFGLHALVVQSIHLLRLRGLKHHLACHAVAQAFARHNLDVRSASTVKDIWRKNMPESYRAVRGRG